MLQATQTLIAEAHHGRRLSDVSSSAAAMSVVTGKTSQRPQARRVGYNLSARLRQRLCSNTCLKFVYLACATLVSASFIIECILAHLILMPYLSESDFKDGLCEFVAADYLSEREKCENKCSKDRSNFPCIQLRVRFSPLDQPFDHGSDSGGSGFCQVLIDEPVHTTEGQLAVRRLPSQKFSCSSNVLYKVEANQSRTVYLYDYFSTFATHKKNKCSTTPCHRRSEDNNEAVKQFELQLQEHAKFFCYARIVSGQDSNEPISTNNDQSQHSSSNPKDNDAAILHRLYSPTMFLHSLLWPVGIFFASLLVLLITYLADGCQAWAGDKTVIA